jgi:tetratricopeptide (TPR) repeat protein
MGFMTAVKANKALRLQKNGDYREAEKLYEEAFAEGMNDPRYLLPYALMILRGGQYQKAKEFLVKHQKAPGMTPSQRTDLLVYYATCCFRLGDTDKGIGVLEQQFRKNETGLLYQTLGYLYVEKYDLEHKPDFAAPAAERPEPAGEAADAEDSEAQDAGTPGAAGADGEAEPVLSPEEAWNAGIDKAEKFIRDSVEYDDEDSVCLDTLAQFLYRVKGDKAAAREWFDKALSVKPNQIDTLYFLSRYDLEAGDRKAALGKLETAAEGRFSPLNYCSKETIQQEIEKLKGVL